MGFIMARLRSYFLFLSWNKLHSDQFSRSHNSFLFLLQKNNEIQPVAEVKSVFLNVS